MTVLQCTCGKALEGTGEELLDAVEAHLADEHRGRMLPDADQDGDIRPNTPVAEEAR